MFYLSEFQINQVSFCTSVNVLSIGIPSDLYAGEIDQNSLQIILAISQVRGYF